MLVQLHIRFRGERQDEKIEFPQVNKDRLDHDTMVVIDNYLSHEQVTGLQVTFIMVP